MKQLIAITIVALMALSLFMVGVVSAQDEVTETELSNVTDYEEIEEDPGVTPDSALYGLERAMERVSLALTFNKAAKAQKGLEHARERLLEVKAMMDAKKADKAAKAREAYQDTMDQVSEVVEGMDEDSDEDTIKGVVGDLAGIKATIEENEMAIEALMNRLAEENLTAEARTALESELADLQNATAELKASLEQRRDEVKNRWRAVSGKNESEIDDEESEIEDEAGLTDKTQRLAERWIARTENALTKLKARVGEAKQESEEAEQEIETPEETETEEEESESEEVETETEVEEENETEVEESEPVSEAPISEEQISSLETYIQDIESRLTEAKAAYAVGDYEQVLEILKPVNNFGRQMSVAVRLKNVDRLERLKEEKVKTQEKLQEVKEKLEQRRDKILNKVQERIKDKLHEEDEESESEDNMSEESEVSSSNKGKKSR